MQNDTIRDNILFNSPYEEDRYQKGSSTYIFYFVLGSLLMDQPPVLHQCALEEDLQLFEAGDQTEVGERGLTLRQVARSRERLSMFTFRGSGGQKARLTLARAIYAKSEIVLLDDVLAALDVHT